MVRITRADVSLMDRPRRTRAAAKELTPAQRERQRQQRQFTRLMGQLTDPSAVFEVRLGRQDKSITIRQRLLRAAQDAGKEVAVRRSPRGFVVGLMTPERRSNRGRKRASATA
jgi:hypothetical protein